MVSTKMLSGITVFNIDNKNRMVSKGSCDTEDWIMCAENTALPSQE